MRSKFYLALFAATMALPLAAGTITYGDADCLNAATNCYGTTNPFGTATAGTTLQGLAPNVVTLGSSIFANPYPFTPGAGDYAGTDQIYVGSTFVGTTDDGYSTQNPTLGPDVITMDYSSLVAGGISTFTLGIAANDFQDPVFGQPFIAKINGTVDAALSAELNSLNQSGPLVQFFTIGIDPALLKGSNVLTLSIDEAGNGGDGWAVDFLTVGVTSSTPEPGTIGLVVAGLALVGVFRRKFTQA